VLDSTHRIAQALGQGALEGFRTRSTGPGWVEISLSFGTLTLAFPEAWSDEPTRRPHLRRARSGYTPLVLLGDEALFAERFAERLLDQGEITLEVLPLGVQRLASILQRHDATLQLRRHAAEGELIADRFQEEIDSLVASGRALSSEKNLDRLLGIILERARFVTNADAGSIYVVEGEDDAVEKRTLRFKAAQNDSVKIGLPSSTLPVSPQSIVGRCVLE